jgi:hypothetical protein
VTYHAESVQAGRSSVDAEVANTFAAAVVASKEEHIHDCRSRSGCNFENGP